MLAARDILGRVSSVDSFLSASTLSVLAEDATDDARLIRVSVESFDARLTRDEALLPKLDDLSDGSGVPKALTWKLATNLT